MVEIWCSCGFSCGGRPIWVRRIWKRHVHKMQVNNPDLLEVCVIVKVIDNEPETGYSDSDEENREEDRLIRSLSFRWLSFRSLSFRWKPPLRDINLSNLDPLPTFRDLAEPVQQFIRDILQSLNVSSKEKVLCTLRTQPFYRMLRGISELHNMNANNDRITGKYIVKVVMVWVLQLEQCAYGLNKFQWLDQTLQMNRLVSIVSYFVDTVIDVPAFEELFVALLSNYETCKLGFLTDADMQQAKRNAQIGISILINKIVERYELTRVLNIFSQLKSLWRYLPDDFISNYSYRTESLYERLGLPDGYTGISDDCLSTLYCTLFTVVDKGFDNLSRVYNSHKLKIMIYSMSTRMPIGILDTMLTEYFALQHVQANQSNIKLYVDLVRYIRRLLCTCINK